MSKSLRAEVLRTKVQNGTIRSLPTVTASTMIARLKSERKVRCHTGDVEICKGDAELDDIYLNERPCLEGIIFGFKKRLH